MCTPLPSGMPEKPIMLGISLLRKVIPSFLPIKISNLPVFLIRLNEKFGSPTARLIAVNLSTTELKFLSR